MYTNATAQTLAGRVMRFSGTKNETLNLRVSQTFKLALKEAADYEQRSMVNMLEVLLGEYYERKGIVPADQQATPPQTPPRTGADHRTNLGPAA